MVKVRVGGIVEAYMWEQDPITNRRELYMTFHQATALWIM